MKDLSKPTYDGIVMVGKSLRIVGCVNANSLPSLKRKAGALCDTYRETYNEVHVKATVFYKPEWFIIYRKNTKSPMGDIKNGRWITK